MSIYLAGDIGVKKVTFKRDSNTTYTSLIQLNSILLYFISKIGIILFASL